MDTSNSVSAMDVLTLAVAILGAVTGIAALAWQAVTFFLSNGRATAELLVAWLGPGGALTGVPGTWNKGEPPAPTYLSESIAVRIRNVGRLPISVTTWSLQIGPTYLQGADGPWNRSLPHRLDVGEEATWFVERGQTEEISQALRARGRLKGKRLGPNVELVATASLGSGKSARSRPWVITADGELVAKRRGLMRRRDGG